MTDISKTLAYAADGRPMSEAPKDKPILAYIIGDCVDPECAMSLLRPSGAPREHLCLFHAHVEGATAAPTGFAIIEWGGAWDDPTYEFDEGHLPDWWFCVGSDFETVASPIAWWPLPKAPEAGQ